MCYVQKHPFLGHWPVFCWSVGWSFSVALFGWNLHLLWMAALLNFDGDFDVGLFENVVKMAFQGDPKTVGEKWIFVWATLNQVFLQLMEAQGILAQFKDHPQAWTRADKILENVCILFNFIYIDRFCSVIYWKQNLLVFKFWNLWSNLGGTFCQLNKKLEYRATLSITSSSLVQTFRQWNATRFSSERWIWFWFRSCYSYWKYISIWYLLQLVKKEWPKNWPTFIPDLMSSSRTSDSLCENNMNILTLMRLNEFKTFLKD